MRGRRSLAVCLLLFSGLVCAAEDDAGYTYAIAFSAELTMTRHAKPEYVDALREARPDCVVVNWSYRARAESSLQDLQNEGARANTAMDEALQASPDAVIAAKTVASRESVWVIYAPSGQALADEIERRLAALEESSSRVRFANDPAWEIFEEHLKRLREPR